MNKRTSFITAGAITGVLLAGTAAVGANIGILNAADNGDVGQLSAAVATTPATVPTSVEPQVIDIYLDEPVVTNSATTMPLADAAESMIQEFAVDVAGTVSVEQTDTGVLLDGVAVAEGWSWSSAQSASGELEVTFTSADSEFLFYASLAEDGTITARVDEPIINIVQVPAAPGSSSGSSSASQAPRNTAPSASYDDDNHEYEDEDHDDDEHDDEYEDHGDDEHDDDEHEGGDDDD